MNDPAAVAPPPEEQNGPHDHQRQGILKLAVGAIGIVFGDIGTSPIYAFRETFAGHHPIAPDPLHIHGVLSLIFWSMMIVVTIKYVVVIMRADNKGEGAAWRCSLSSAARFRSADGRPGWSCSACLPARFSTATA